MRTLPCLLAATLFAAPLTADQPTNEPATQPSAPATRPTTKPIDPKALSDKVKLGLGWIVKAQLADGGWGQGDESRDMGGGQPLAGTSNVADSCVAIQALMRSGSTPKEGDYTEQILKGVEFVCTKIDAADNDSLYVTDVRGTRVQSKIGAFVDTFLAAQVLSDVSGQMPTEPANARVNAMLVKTVRKIEKNQQKDGGFAQGGWAPALGDGLAAKAMNQMAVREQGVSEDSLKRMDAKAMRDYDEKGNKVDAAGSASVELYARSSNSSNFANAEFRYEKKQEELEKIANNPATQPAARAAAQQELAIVGELRKEAQQAQQGAVARMNDKNFTDGFGSNGGEEFLSYLNVGEGMAVRGDPAFAEWDKKMTDNLSRVQNDDGSWSGHHCITGKTFCTSSALMVLMVDRTTSPTGDPLKKR